MVSDDPGPLDRTRILLRGLQVRTRVGWGEEERRVPQLLVLDLDLELEPERSGRVTGRDADPGRDADSDREDPDDLALTVDYAALAARVAELVSGRTRRLLETVAGDVLIDVLRDRRVGAATVTVHKPDAPMPVAVDDVAVVRTRRRARA